MSKHAYLRAYMAGVTVPTVLLVFIFACFCVVRFGYHFPLPIERGLVFPLAVVPPLWGLWNMLYVVLRRHWNIPIGLHGAVVPLFVGPLAFATARMVVVDIPPFLVTFFPFGVAIAAVGYYLVWKYLVGFLNELVEIGY